jgi:uncharacterized protein (UPF0332 family)
MLTEKQIKEAERNIKRYFDEGLIKKCDVNPNVLTILKRNAQESLLIANFLYKNNKSSLWVITTAYYSMYYIANALLYYLGYKIGDRISHKVTVDALIALVRTKLTYQLIEDYNDVRVEALARMKSDELIESLDYERKKRSLIQYNTPEKIKISKVKTSLIRAKKFMLELTKLMET